MEIRLKKGHGKHFETLHIDGAVTGETLVQEFGGDPEYRILAMKVGNRMTDLTEEITQDCDVELLDMRDNGANLVYQRSVSMIYIKAVKDILGDVRVEIDNSLNKGVYTEIKLASAVREQQVRDVATRMQQLIDADMPFRKVVMDRGDAVSYFYAQGLEKKAKLIEQNETIDEVVCYELDGYVNSFYGPMVPSTGYI